ncbi:MAG: type II secretion system F family protein, partial [Acidobacteria bacterium]|nr:type II secretion system F family protein [Acidobacteriota bacterium]
MEFRCRLGTAAGQVIEGVYVAPSEAHLRRELEDKGLHVLALAPRGGVQGFSIGRRKIRRDELLIFNQELATLLKAGMPLVQSL